MNTIFQTVPGVSTPYSIQHRHLFVDTATRQSVAANAVLDGTKTRDAANTDVAQVRAGVVLGKITSGGKYANSIIGLSGGVLASNGTSLTIPAAVSTELTRRVGITGTFKLTGPPTAAGTVRTLTATYSALGATTATITALGVNEVQTITFGATATGGTMQLRVPLASGLPVDTGAITWNGTDATWLAAINTALDAATGVSGGIVATGAAPDDAITLTFSGTGYAALPQSFNVQVLVKPTSVTTVSVAKTTTGVDGRFVTLSIIAPTDGSETPVTFVPDGYGIAVLDQTGTSADQLLSPFYVKGDVDVNQIVNYPSDASLKTWLKAQLRTSADFTFSDDR